MKRKGFTLVELIIVMTLLTVVIGLSLTILVSSLNAQTASYNEYDLQNRIRETGMKVNDVINTSSAIFTIPMETFNKKRLSLDWDYYGLSEDGSEYVFYEYDPLNKTHHKKVLAFAGAGFRFKLVFNRPLDAVYNEVGNKFIGYRLELFKKGETQDKDVPTGYFVETEIEAKNSNQVVHRGTDENPATAIAVRSQSKFLPNKNMAVVHMVFDCSGSMGWNLEGQRNSIPEEDQRITKLKKAAVFILEKYKEDKEIDIVLYPFSSSANMLGGSFTYSKHKQPYASLAEREGKPLTYTGNTIYTNNADVVAKHGYIKNSTVLTDENEPTFSLIKEMSSAQSFVNGLKAEGGTNVSDALRRVYQNIKFMDKEYVKKVYKNTGFEGATISHYVVILCDGVPTYTPLFMLRTHSIDPADTSMYAFYDFGGNYYTQDKNGNPRRYMLGGNNYYFRDVHLGTYHNYDNVSTDDVNDIIQSFEGRSIKHYGAKIKNAGVKKTFVIGFSKVKKDNGGVDYIAECCGVERSDFPKQVIKFSDENVDDLNKVFVDIKNIIMQDFWLIKGPEL